MDHNNSIKKNNNKNKGREGEDNNSLLATLPRVKT